MTHIRTVGGVKEVWKDNTKIRKATEDDIILDNHKKNLEAFRDIHFRFDSALEDGDENSARGILPELNEVLARLEESIDQLKQLTESLEKPEIEKVQKILDDLREKKISVAESHAMLSEIEKSEREKLKELFDKPEKITSDMIIEKLHKGEKVPDFNIKIQERKDRETQIRKVLGPKEIKHIQIIRDCSGQSKDSQKVNDAKKKLIGMPKPQGQE